MRLCDKIVLASMNPQKWEEFRVLFATYPEVEITSPEGMLRNPDKLAFVEIYSTYLENAIAKSRLVNQATHYPSLADDTGLEVDALQGAPGVRSFRFASPPSAEANRNLLLQKLAEKRGAPRTARFVTALALTLEGLLLHAQGTLEGAISETPRGGGGFGYDSIFIPKGQMKTLAELTATEKNEISHRAIAVHQLMQAVRSNGIVFVKP
jgi:XTP/dITP diphosphohydrolase